MSPRMAEDETSRVAGDSRPEADLARPADPIRRLQDWLSRWRGWLFAGLAVLYLAGFTGTWRLGEDSSLYLVLARSLAEGEGFRFGGQWHRFGFPGLPWLMAPLYRLFGEAAPAAATWLMLLITGLTLAGVYRLFRLHAGAGVAVAMVLALGVCENFYRYGFQVRNDMPYLLGIVAVLAGYEGLRRGREQGGRPAVDWAMVAGGMAVLTCMRPVMLVFHAALLAAAAWGVAWGPKRAMHAVLVAMSVAAVLLFFQLDPRRQAEPTPAGPPAAVASHNAQAEATLEAEAEAQAASEKPEHVPRYESSLRSKLVHWPHTLERGLEHWAKLTWGGVLCEAVLGIELGHGVLNAPFAAVLLFAGLLLAWKRPVWGLFVAATLGQMLLFPPLERYLLPVIPLLLFAGWQALTWASRRLPDDRSKWLVTGVLILALGPNLGLCVAFIAEQRAADTYAAQDGGRFARVPHIAQAVEANVPLDAVLISEEVRILTLLTHRPGRTAAEANSRWRIGEGSDARWRPPDREVWAVLHIPMTPGQRKLIESSGVRVAKEAARSAPRGNVDDVASLSEAERGWRLVRLAFD